MLLSVCPTFANLQLVHGMCEHKERNEPLMQFMAARGYACVIHDKSMFACEKEGRELSNDNFKKTLIPQHYYKYNFLST